MPNSHKKSSTTKYNRKGGMTPYKSKNARKHHAKKGNVANREIRREDQSVIKQELETSKEVAVIELDVIQGSKIQNDFLHAMAVFEEGKQLGEYEKITIKGNPDLNTLCENFKKAYELAGRNVVFVGINTVNGIRSKTPIAYIKPNIQTVSDGDTFWLLKEMLQLLGYKVKTNEHMQVLSVSV